MTATATSIDEAALLAAICAHPEEDTPRLAYADWLQEHGRRQDECDQRLAVLMRGIKAAPGDDAPRLQYADVCEQYGRTERAEFIRVQCELATFSPKHLCENHMCRCAGCEQWNRLGLAAWRLFCRNAERWHGIASAVAHRKNPLDNSGERLCLESDDCTLTFHRGFIAEVTCTAADWLEHGGSIDAQHPVTAVTLTEVDGLLLGRCLLVQREGGVNEWWARITHPDPGAGGNRWPHIIFTLPS